MKRKHLLFISLTLLGYLYSFANEHPYRPLVEEGKEWHYKYKIGFMWSTIYYPDRNVVFKIQGDTIIDSKSYKKVYSYTDYDSIPDCNTPYGFIREDCENRVIYGRENRSFDYDAQMRLLTSFNHSGEYIIFDMLNPRNNNFDSWEELGEFVAVTKTFEGMEYYGFEWENYGLCSYFEGLGFLSESAADIFGIVMLTSGSQGYLPYIYRIKDGNGTTLYYNPEMDGINDVSVASNTLVVERNGDSLRFIESNPNSNVIEYEVYNMQGASISHGKVDVTGVVNISHLSQGMYIVQARASDSHTQIKFLK